MSVRCTFAAALRGWRGILELELSDGADVADALSAARAMLQARQDIDARAILVEPEWQQGVTGIFGEVCARSRRVEPGDRIELYRALEVDPKEARRARARERQTEKGRNPLTVSGAASRRS